MSNLNVAVKQARMWKAEVEEMYRRKKPYSESQIKALAAVLAKADGAELREGVCPAGLPTADRIEAWIGYLTPSQL